MAESQKEAPSATPKKKSPLPEDNNGKDFLVTWKSTAEDKDDLGFSTGADHRERMKLFDFGKLDDFEFDAEFGKVSSFKLDMPDLDFSSPKKRSAKFKERLRGEAISGKPERKANFAFSFDFNELDSFEIDTKMLKEENKLNKINENEGFDIFEDDIKKFPKTGIANCSNPKDPLGRKVELDTRNERACSSPAEFEQSGLPEELPPSPLKPKTSANGSNHETDHRERTLMVGSKILNAGKLIQDSSDQSSDFIQQAENVQIQTASLSSVIVDEHCHTIDSSSTILDANSGKENGNHCMRLEGSSHSKTSSPVKAHDPKCLTAFSTVNSLRAENEPEKNQVNQKGVAEENAIQSEPPKTQKAIEENSLAPGLDKFLSEPRSNGDQRNGGSKLQLFLHRDSKCEQFLATKDKRSTGLQLLPRTKAEAARSKLNSSITPKQLYAICNRKMEATSTRYYNSKGDNTGDVEQSGSQGGAFNKSFDLSMKVVSLTARKSDTNHEDESTSRLDSALQRPASISGPINITNAASSSEKRGNSVKRYDLYNMNISRETKSNNSTSNAVTIETKSEVSSKGNTAETLNPSPLASHSLTMEKRAVLSPSFKRKSIEVESQVDPATVRSSKRRPPSPSEARRLLQISPIVLHGPTGRQKGTSEGFYGVADLDDQNRLVDVRLESGAMALEVPVLSENDGNVEKAEACAKELENICSMLRRKHEEAKELLVRAVVTNNALLMLDHPLYEEKISLLCGHPVDAFPRSRRSPPSEACAPFTNLQTSLPSRDSPPPPSRRRTTPESPTLQRLVCQVRPFSTTFCTIGLFFGRHHTSKLGSSPCRHVDRRTARARFRKRKSPSSASYRNFLFRFSFRPARATPAPRALVLLPSLPPF